MNQKLILGSYLSILWRDDSLQWDPNNYNGVESFLYPQKEIWLPDIVIDNSLVRMGTLGYDANVVE